MNTKKGLIIFFIFLIVVSLALAIYLYVSSLKKTTKTQTPALENSSNNETLPNKPNAFNIPTDKTPEGTSSSQNLRKNTEYFFSDSNKKEDINKTFGESLKKTDYPNNINWISYATKDNKQISLNEFSASLEIKIDSRLNNFLDSYNYDRIVCKNSSGNLDYGLVINNKLFRDYPTLNQEEINILRAWEPTMLKDLYKVLFPDTTFTDAELNQTLTFKNGTYRYTDITLPDNKKGSINYHTLVDSIVFTNSLECMNQASEAIESID